MCGKNLNYEDPINFNLLCSVVAKLVGIARNKNFFVQQKAFEEAYYNTDHELISDR